MGIQLQVLKIITYEVTDIYNEAIEAGMIEILNTAGFELIDGGDLDLEEEIETMKTDYGEKENSLNLFKKA